MTTPLVGSSAGRVGGVGVRNAFFPRILVHLIGLDHRVAGQRRRVGRHHRQFLEPVPQAQQVRPVPLQLAGQSGGGGALGDTAEDQQDLRGTAVGLLERGPGPGVEDPAAGIAAVVEDRGDDGGDGPSIDRRPAAQAGQTAGVEQVDEFGIAGVLVQEFGDGKVHDPGP